MRRTPLTAMLTLIGRAGEHRRGGGLWRQIGELVLIQVVDDDDHDPQAQVETGLLEPRPITGRSRVACPTVELIPTSGEPRRS